MSTDTRVLTIDTLTRLANSVNGNPRYRVHFTNGETAVTMSDAAFCYGITNPGMRGPLAVTFTRAGRISHAAPARERCGTIGCNREAAHVLTYTFPESRGNIEREHVCEECGAGYARRPALRASLAPITR